MKILITLFCLNSCITLHAAQVAKVLMEEQEIAAQQMFQVIHDKNNVYLKKLLQKYPGIANEMPGTKIKLPRSALYYAIKAENHEALCLLLEYNANPDIQCGHDKYTALMWASHFNDPNCVKTLIAAGVDKEFTNEKQKTALGAAEAGDASLTSQRSIYEAAMKKYYQAIAAGEAERDRYAVEKQIAFEEIANIIGIKDLSAIVCGYAYGILPRDLPKELPEDLPKEKNWLSSHCAIQ